MATPEQIQQANIGAIKLAKQNENRLRTKYPEVPDLSYLIRNMNQEERNRVMKSIKTAMSTLPASALLLTNE